MWKVKQRRAEYTRHPMGARWVTLSLSVLLTACATPGRLDLGSTDAVALERLGSPTLETQTEQGERRLIYSQQPNGQTAWLLDFDAQGTLVRRTQALTPERFAEVQADGTWDQARLLREFGPPAERLQEGRPPRTIWTWRHLDTRGLVGHTRVELSDAGTASHLMFVPEPRRGFCNDPWACPRPDGFFLFPNFGFHILISN